MDNDIPYCSPEHRYYSPEGPKPLNPKPLNPKVSGLQVLLPRRVLDLHSGFWERAHLEGVAPVFGISLLALLEETAGASQMGLGFRV